MEGYSPMAIVFQINQLRRYNHARLLSTHRSQLIIFRVAIFGDLRADSGTPTDNIAVGIITAWGQGHPFLSG